jgi:hypothetical protein
MKVLLFVACLACAFFSCDNISGSPKQSLTNFLTALDNSNFTEAKKYATSDSQGLLDLVSKGSYSGNVYNGKTFTINTIEVNGDEAKAEVIYSPGTTQSFKMRREHDEWKVEYSFSALIDMAKDVIKKEGIDIDKEVKKAVDSIKINLDSLP